MNPTNNNASSSSADCPSRVVQRPSLRGAIDAKCRECTYDPKSGAGTWRQQVTACTSRTCPLYPVRPTSEGRHGD